MDKNIRNILVVLASLAIILSKIDNRSLEKSEKFNTRINIRNSLIREIQKDKNYSWSRYDSSKWVDSYKILNVKKLNYKTYDIKIELLLNNTTGESYKVDDSFIINIK